MIADPVCPRAKDENTPCYLKSGESALDFSDDTAARCDGCRLTVTEIEAVQKNPTAKRFEAMLSVTNVGMGAERVVLEGVDISHLTRGLEIQASPGELLDVQISLLLNANKAVHFPECLANVMVVDLARSINLEMVLRDLVDALRATDPTDPSVVSAMSRAEQVLGEMRDDENGNDTVAGRRKKSLW